MSTPLNSPGSLPDLASAIRAEIASRLTRLARSLADTPAEESADGDVTRSLTDFLATWKGSATLPLADSGAEHRLLRRLFPAGLTALDAYRELPDSPEVLLDQALQQSGIIGNSPELRDIMSRALLLAATPARVLISGETGTGKDVIARFIHEHSARRAKPYVVVNCGALTPQLTLAELFGHEPHSFTGAAPRGRKGKVEAAHGGTLFLDEVADLSEVGQSALLRLLDQGEIQRIGSAQTQSVDVRIISATHRNLMEMVERGAFREDLYYRLVVVELSAPPLRRRGEDVLLLAAHFMNQLRLQYGRAWPRGFTPAARSTLLNFPWKGNVRQLKHAIEHAFIHAQDELLDEAHFPMLKKVASPAPIAAPLNVELLSTDVTNVLGRPSQHIVSYLQLAPGHWFTTVNAASRLDSSEATVRTRLRALADAGVLERHGERRGRRYRVAPQYILDFAPKNSDINSLGEPD